MNLKAIIIDDEVSARQTLKNMISEYTEDVEIIAEASSAEKGLKVLQTETPDLVFLDIRMSPHSGFDILSQLSDIRFEIIFTTAYDQYALKAIKFSALDYLIKPINPTELILAIEKVKKKVLSKEPQLMDPSIFKGNVGEQFNKITLPSGNLLVTVELKNIIHCEGDRNYTIFHFTDQPIIHSSRTLKEYEEMFEGNTFFRIQKSHLVNLIHVKKYIKGRGGEVLMTDGAILQVSREKKKLLLEQLRKLQ